MHVSSLTTLIAIRIHTMMWCLFVAGGSIVAMGESVQAVQLESHEEKETHLKQQSTGGLFKKWTFDQDRPNEAPPDFVGLASGHGQAAAWVVQGNAMAPSLPNVVMVSARCAAGSCYQLLLAKGLDYEYPDITVRFRAPEGKAGIGGVVLCAKDAANFYAAVVDLVGRTAQVVRMVAGSETELAQAPITLKPIDWHSLRVQRNTIISKDFIEMFVDGILVLSVEDQTFDRGQVGLLARGDSSLLFDTLHAVPLFSHRPLSSPAAY